MKSIITLFSVVGLLLTVGANGSAEARAQFSFYLGGPPAPQYYYYETPHYYVAPVAPRYYVAPSYYVAPRPHCHPVYTPYGPVYHMHCY
jgi:hypothetical protein